MLFNLNASDHQFWRVGQNHISNILKQYDTNFVVKVNKPPLFKHSNFLFKCVVYGTLLGLVSLAVFCSDKVKTIYCVYCFYITHFLSSKNNEENLLVNLIRHTTHIPCQSERFIRNLFKTDYNDSGDLYQNIR